MSGILVWGKSRDRTRCRWFYRCTSDPLTFPRKGCPQRVSPGALPPPSEGPSANKRISGKFPNHLNMTTHLYFLTSWLNLRSTSLSEFSSCMSYSSNCFLSVYKVLLSFFFFIILFNQKNRKVIYGILLNNPHHSLRIHLFFFLFLSFSHFLYPSSQSTVNIFETS